MEIFHEGTNQERDSMRDKVSHRSETVSEFDRFCHRCIAEDDLEMLEVAFTNQAFYFGVVAQVLKEHVNNRPSRVYRFWPFDVIYRFQYRKKRRNASLRMAVTKHGGRIGKKPVAVGILHTALGKFFDKVFGSFFKKRHLLVEVDNGKDVPPDKGSDKHREA